MSTTLGKDKQIAIIGALAEGSSIRSIERLTGVHRDMIPEAMDFSPALKLVQEIRDGRKMINELYQRKQSLGLK